MEKALESGVLKFTLIYFIVLVFLHNIFGIFGIYHSVWWTDDLMHFLGGAWLASLFFYIFKIKNKAIESKSNFLTQIILALGFVVLIGVFWEFYEFLADVYLYKTHSLTLSFDPLLLFDTLGDLFLDLCGGLIFSWVFINFLNRNTLGFFKKTSSVELEQVIK